MKSSRFRRNSVRMSASADVDVDVAVIGGGIAGSIISWSLQETEKCRVALIDPQVNKPGTWYPNYGAWRCEWHRIADRLKLQELKDCTTTEWEITDCFFGGSNEMPVDQRTTLPCPYIRVDRVKMQALLRNRFAAAGGLPIASKLTSKRISPNLFDKNLVHTADSSVLTLDNGKTVRCKVLIDASGLESKLVGRESPMLARGSEKELSTGYQIAYGFIALIDKINSYDPKAMTLFDYRYIVFCNIQRSLLAICQESSLNILFQPARIPTLLLFHIVFGIQDRRL
jgi:lycopene beta-cyclase